MIGSQKCHLLFIFYAKCLMLKMQMELAYWGKSRFVIVIFIVLCYNFGEIINTK